MDQQLFTASVAYWSIRVCHEGHPRLKLPGEAPQVLGAPPKTRGLVREIFLKQQVLWEAVSHASNSKCTALRELQEAGN